MPKVHPFLPMIKIYTVFTKKNIRKKTGSTANQAVEQRGPLSLLKFSDNQSVIKEKLKQLELLTPPAPEELFHQLLTKVNC